MAGAASGAFGSVTDGLAAEALQVVVAGAAAVSGGGWSGGWGSASIVAKEDNRRKWEGPVYFYKPFAASS